MHEPYKSITFVHGPYEFVTYTCKLPYNLLTPYVNKQSLLVCKHSLICRSDPRHTELAEWIVFFEEVLGMSIKLLFTYVLPIIEVKKKLTYNSLDLMIVKTWLKYHEDNECYGVIMTKLYWGLELIYGGGKAKKEALESFIKGIFENFPKNYKSIVVPYWDHGHCSMYMFEDGVTIHHDYVEGFHRKNDKDETFCRLIRAM